MIIKGIGTDIINVNRVNRLRKDAFAKKILSEYEYKSTTEAQRLDPMYLSFVFASKEAVVKSIGTGFVGIFFNEISIHFDYACSYATVNCDNTEINDLKYYLSFEYAMPKAYSELFIIAKCIAYYGEYEDICSVIKNDCLMCLHTIDINDIDEKLLSQDELELKPQSKAANIAAKKAVFSLLVIDDFTGLYSQTSVLRDKSGKPYFITEDVELNNKLSKYNVFISLSHEKEKAVAFALLQEKG